ncbi:fibronectin type III and SPRY domain-containing protein 2-like [Branchiostoma floridae]|uniref:Fibronectin type III and SPRY domain-containing protein 2-like n=1 Tax=Branchiostoma floridae TaxID=7739 RepID=A0A9J7KW16_BRAFL|nr:fibronectin type III and SPRY domain-containing protein 2-like [Branchiostoma floridae]
MPPRPRTASANPRVRLFRQILDQIAGMTTDTDFGIMYHMCRGYLSSRDLQSAQTPELLFRILKSKGLLSEKNMSLLEALLKKCKRDDLLTILYKKKEELSELTIRLPPTKLPGFDFRFRPVTAHSYLSLSNRNRTVAFEDGEDHYIRSPSVCERFNGASYSVLGDTPFPAVGKHYLEVSVRESMSYSVGVALRMTPRDEHLGSNELSWCLRHTHVDGSYVTLHQGREHKRLWKGVFPVRRLGVLMDSDRGLLIFQDAERKAPLDTMYVRFEQGYMQYWCACYPERLYPAVELFHGNITVHTGYSVPKHLWNFNEDTSQGESSTWWRWYRNPSSMLSEPPYSPADIGMVTRSSEGSR